ncbi:hypothetical protein F53441_2843 [Fusarium austroafricanum]|uniref:Uncharacterized protein n=1 Tax=Fusarium austroafricanum TaxID=2364996 RepID=A0A8H4KNX1_9HYPO|nr:hypothetical protein F53441_2843 [Fusarium austroafricanum]
MSRLPPAEKLPLAVRKNIRDSWENTKEGHEKKLSEVLGQPWTINIDPKALYPYAEEGSWGSTSMGDLIVSYVEGVEYQLKYFIDSNGDGAKDEINEICTAHVLTMDFDEKKTVSYCGTKVSPDGELVILFTEGNLGTNTNYAADNNNLTKALNEAPSTARPMSYVARAGIRSDYDANFQQVQEKLNKILGQEIAIVPNFEANFEKLKANTKDNDWEQNFGRSHFSYLEGLVSTLEYEKFGEDEMLQEGLLEAMDKHAVHVRVVDQTKRSYNETVIEDGILYLQTSPKDFGVNVHQVASDIVNIL